jgi:hypothetical protein
MNIASMATEKIKRPEISEEWTVIMKGYGDTKRQKKLK